MNAIANTSKVVLATALLSIAFTGCGRKAEQTGSTGSTAPGSSTTTAPTAGTTDGSTSGTAGTTSQSGSTTGPAATAGGTSGSSTTETPGTTSSGSGTQGGASTSGSSGTTSGSSESSGSSLGSAIDDSAITAKVKAALLADADVKSTDINVETKKGEVQLSGFVSNPQQVDRAVKVASAVDGVKKVDNKLTVKK